MNMTIKTDPIKGRGVFALDSVKRGETVEVCEIILLDYHKLQDDLEGYVYQYSKNKVALALGNGSLFNHSDSPNCEFSFNYKKKQLLIKACKDIQQGQEMTIDYGYDSESKKRFNIRS